MGSGEKRHLNFHMHLQHFLHHHHHHHQVKSNNKEEEEEEMKGVPKGCMAVLVGHEGEEQLQRFIIPIVYINHPLFLKLLKEAEEEYGFDQKGPITIPCHVEQFRTVQGLIDRERHHHHHHAHHHHHHHHHHQDHHNHHHFLCFKA